MTRQDAVQDIRVRIINPEHPHYPEHGHLTGNVVKLFGRLMAEMSLDSCRHGVSSCFVGTADIRSGDS